MKEKIQKRFSVIQFLWWAAMIGGIYIVAYLKELGLSGTQIGVTSSIGALFGAILLPVMGKLSDRLGSAKTPLLITAGAGVFLCMFLPLVGRTVTKAPMIVMVFSVVLLIIRAQQNSLADSFCIGVISDYGIPYTQIRMWGSLGYTSISLIVTALMAKAFPMEIVFYVSPLLFLPLGFLIARADREKLAQAKPAATENREKVSLKAIFKNYYFVVYVVFVLGLNVQQGITFMYLPYLLGGAGIDGKYLALFTGFRSVFELLSMLICVRLCKSGRVKLWQILLFSGAFFSLEHVLYPMAKGYLMMFLIMIPSGLASGIQYGVAPNYIFKIVDERVRYTCQTINGVCISVVSIVGTLCGGLIIDHYGIYALTNVNLCILIAATLTFAVFNLLGPKLAKGCSNA